MKCTVYDLEVIASNPGQVELVVRRTSVKAISEQKISEHKLTSKIAREWKLSPLFFCVLSCTLISIQVHIILLGAVVLFPGSKTSIPLISYPKAIDIWMCVCMIFRVRGSHPVRFRQYNGTNREEETCEIPE